METAKNSFSINPVRGYGCGICRSACEMAAIDLKPRNDHLIAQNLW